MAIYSIFHDAAGVVYAIQAYELITIIKDYPANLALLESPTDRLTYLLYLGINRASSGA